MTRQQDIEEVLGIIWEAEEHGNTSIDNIKTEIKNKSISDLIEEIEKNGLIVSAGQKLSFSTKGRELAKDVIRRQRLAERLLYDVLEVPPTESDSQACAFEHIISKEVEESICTLLGHPRQCPHGSVVPEGDCCRRAATSFPSIVSSLDTFKVGEKGKILYVLTKDHPQLHKLMSLGVMPGTVIKVHQIFPSYVIQVSETQLALEKEVAKSIYLKKV
ncbi:MAG: metal-dependent transcriptional regulator [Elusimicrobia bacterium]|nr:metal-dependent transcriptional regulator [Elusimicrobiota bacterium]